MAKVQPLNSFSVTSATGRTTIYEGGSAIYIVDNETGDVACMGDGVGMVSSPDGEQMMDVGTPDFYDHLTRIVTDCEPDFLWAYFNR